EGYVSADTARTVYGVVLGQWTVDAEKTRAARAAVRSRRRARALAPETRIDDPPRAATPVGRLSAVVEVVRSGGALVARCAACGAGLARAPGSWKAGAAVAVTTLGTAAYTAVSGAAAPLRAGGDAAVRWLAGAGGADAAVDEAAMALATGMASCVVVYRPIAMGQFQRFGRALAGDVAGGRPLDAALGFALPFGLVNATVGKALLVRRHMHLYGTTREHLGHVAVTFRRHANRNPAAVMHRRPMTLADHAAARPIVEPFGLLDCCLETDGADALVLVSAERARGCRHRPVYVMAAAEGSGPRFGCGAWAMHCMPEDDYATGNTQRLAATLYRTVGIGPGDVDCAQLYDHYT